MLQEKLIGKIWQHRLVLLIIGITLASVFILWTPRDIANLISHPHPVQGYAEAVQRIKSLQAQEGQEMNPDSCLQFMTHDKQVERVIVFVHGYTNCPQQFSELGKRFYDLGYNVLIAPLPHHGLSDRMTEEHARLTAEELVTYADTMADIAQGLGRQVVMSGISAGGVMVAWLSQYRGDVDLAVIISPSFGYQQIPTALTVPATNLYLSLPNLFRWWDSSRQADIKPDYVYPRYSTRAIFQFLRLGFAVQTAAQQRPPASSSILVVTNANDMTVNNALTARLVNKWCKYNTKFRIYEFEARLRLGHDLIDPNQPDQQIDIVYPRLIELITSNLDILKDNGK